MYTLQTGTSELLVLRILQDFELQATTALSLLEEADGRGWDLHRWWGKKDEQGRKAGKVEDRCTDRALNPLCGKQQVRCTRGAICKRQIRRRFFFRKSTSENNAEHYFKWRPPSLLLSLSSLKNRRNLKIIFDEMSTKHEMREGHSCREKFIIKFLYFTITFVKIRRNPHGVKRHISKCIINEHCYSFPFLQRAFKIL